MTEKFDEILDQCIDSINKGDSIDDCLARYPEHAAELMPLLRTVAGAHSAVPFTPSAEKKQAARQRMLALMASPESKAKRPFLAGFFRQTRVWASAAAFTAVALIAVFGIMPLINNNSTPGSTIAENNFALMISDDPTIVNMFESVEITINEFSLNHATEGWKELIPETTTIDLTQIKGDLAQKIWEGTLPAGSYTAVRVNIAEVDAVFMIPGGGTLDINITTEIELVLELTFDITEEDLTNFVYDITVLNQSGTLGTVPDDSGVMEEGEFVIYAP
ncbi:DUF4382 domain-containing protein [Chloroflexota bacterium]